MDLKSRDRVTTMVDSVGTTTYAYTPAGQLRIEDGPFADDPLTNTYAFRLRVNLDLKQPSGVWTNAFVYDAARRLTDVTSPAGTFTYQLAATQPSTLIHQLALPGGGEESLVFLLIPTG